MDGKRIRRILVATDFSSPGVFEEAVSLARALDASIDLVHVREPFDYAVTGGFAPLANHDAVVIDWIDQSLAEHARRASEAGLACVTTSLVGSAPAQIVAHADKIGADLVVVGSHGAGSLAHMVAHAVAHALLGSTTERVIHRSRRPVLVVPCADTSAPAGGGAGQTAARPGPGASPGSGPGSVPGLAPRSQR